MKKALIASLPEHEFGTHKYGDHELRVTRNSLFDPALVDQAFDKGELTEEEYLSVCETKPSPKLVKEKFGDELVRKFYKQGNPKIGAK